MSKSNGKRQSSQNHQKFEELEVRERELGLVRDQNGIEQNKQECARRNIEILSRLDISSSQKHEQLKKEVLETIKGNLSVLTVK